MLNEDNSFCCSPIIDVAVITYKASGKTYGKNLDTKILQVYCKATSFRVREFSRGLQEPGHCKSSSPYSYFFFTYVCFDKKTLDECFVAKISRREFVYPW